MNDVILRRATAADSAIVHRMVMEIAEHEGSTVSVRSTEEDWRRMLAQPHVSVVIAERGDEALGYVSAVRQLTLWLGQDLLALDDLWVRETARNAGIGRRLMLEIARLAAVERLLIRWGVRTDNLAGQRFYQRLGATIATKSVAVWTPDSYLAALEEEAT